MKFLDLCVWGSTGTYLSVDWGEENSTISLSQVGCTTQSKSGTESRTGGRTKSSSTPRS